jgi:deazaflavin-dependent oxidoreductase (nitroreductase family)
MSAGAGDAQFLYLTTTGRKTGQPRQIEIWFVADRGRLYVLAEHGRRAQWVRNIIRNPRVRVRVGARDAAEVTATAQPLDRTADAGRWQHVQQLARDKYGWGDGLPVEITPDA